MFASVAGSVGHKVWCFIGTLKARFDVSNVPNFHFWEFEKRKEDAIITVFGDVAQLGERGVRNAEARSSILLISTNIAEARTK